MGSTNDATLPTPRALAGPISVPFGVAPAGVADGADWLEVGAVVVVGAWVLVVWLAANEEVAGVPPAPVLRTRPSIAAAPPLTTATEDAAAAVTINFRRSESYPTGVEDGFGDFDSGKVPSIIGHIDKEHGTLFIAAHWPSL